MRLFWLIHKATVEQDADEAWKIILQFEALINRESKKLFSNEINEDLKSEMQIKLFRRIRNFKILED